MTGIAVAAHSDIHGDEGPEFHVVQSRTAVEVFPVPIYVVGPGFQIIIAIGIECAAVYLCFNLSELEQGITVIDIA